MHCHEAINDKGVEVLALFFQGCRLLVNFFPPLAQQGKLPGQWGLGIC